MNLDYEQTFVDISDTQLKMTMQPEIPTLTTHTAIIQTNVDTNVLDQLIFKAEVDVVRRWIIEAGFSTATHAYDFATKKIIELKTNPRLIVPKLSGKYIVENLPIIELSLIHI